LQIKQTIAKAVIKAFGLTQWAKLWLADEEGSARGGSSRASRPYSQIAIVYRCVNVIINTLGSLPLMLSTADDRLVESGPVYDLFFNRKQQSWHRFLTQTIGHFILSGDVFWVFDKPGSDPEQIRIVNGTQMREIIRDGQFNGWEYQGKNGERVFLDPAEVWQIKTFNPNNEYHGTGPIEAAKMNLNFTYAADLHSWSSLNNGAEPGTVLVVPAGVKLSEEEIRARISAFDARHKGAARTKKTACLTGGMDIKTVAQSMVDMQTAELGRMSDYKICSVFGVPPEIVGIETEAQYSKGPAMRNFIFNTIMPLASLLGSEITAGIISRFFARPDDTRRAAPVRNKYYLSAKRQARDNGNHLFAWLDPSAHPTVQEYTRETAEQVLKFTGSGIPLNQLIEAHDLPYEQVQWGDQWWISAGQVPADYILDEGLDAAIGPSLPEGGEEPQDQEDDDQKSIINKSFEIIRCQLAELCDPKKDIDEKSEAQRLRIWRKWVTSWAAIEREYKGALRSYFLRQRRELASKLRAALKSARTKDNEEIIARVQFSLRDEDRKLRIIHKTFFDKAASLGTAQTISEVTGADDRQLRELVADALDRETIKRSLQLSSSTVTRTNLTTRQNIARELAEGLNNSETLPDLTSRLEKVLDGSRARSQMIARTQTGSAVSAGRQAGMETSGVQLKGWLTSRDNSVRPSHKAAEFNYADGIPVSQPFEIGGSILMYPGDPAGSAAEVINCRCVSVVKKTQDKNFDLEIYDTKNFINYEDIEKWNA